MSIKTKIYSIIDWVVSKYLCWWYAKYGYFAPFHMKLILKMQLRLLNLQIKKGHLVRNNEIIFINFDQNRLTHKVNFLSDLLRKKEVQN